GCSPDTTVACESEGFPYVSDYSSRDRLVPRTGIPLAERQLCSDPKNYSTRRARWVLKARTRYRLSTVRIAPHPGLWEQAPTEGGTPRTQLEISRGCGRRTVGLSLYPREPRRAAWGSQVTTLLPLRC